jgi:(p)ppGpp synthase/HD superfamily hydrolase
MLRLNDIVERVQSSRPSADIELINKAYVFTAKVHHGQLLQSRTHLIHPERRVHPPEWNLDETVVTGLLHHGRGHGGDHGRPRPAWDTVAQMVMGHEIAP